MRGSVNVLKNTFHIILAFVIFFGLLFGPFIWYFSHQMHAEYADFVENGIQTSGTVYSKDIQGTGRGKQYFVGIRYNTNGQFNTLASKVEVELAMHSNLEIGDKIKVYYKRPIKDVNDLAIKGQMDKGNIGPIYWTGVGMTLTLIGYLMLFAFIFFKRQTMKILGLKDRSHEIKGKKK